MKNVRKLLTTPISLIGIILILVYLVIAILAPVLAPYEDYDDRFDIPRDGYRAEPQPPSWMTDEDLSPGDEDWHWLGTTEGQYDIYYGLVWGTRTAFKAGLIVTFSTVVIGLLIGTIASYYGGAVDEVLMRIVEVFMAFPYLLAALTIATVLQPFHRFV